VQELAQLPQPRKKIGQVNPRPMFPPGWVNLGAWLAKRDRLDAIMQQRVILFRARDAVRGRKDYAIREANSRRGNLIILQNQLRELVGKNRRDKNSYDNTKRAFVAAQQQLGFANREEAFAIEREIQGIQAIGLRIEQVLDANARAGRQLEVRFGVEQRALDSAESQYNTALSEENGLVSQANGLRMEWLTIINPFDTIAREDFQLALQQCGEWVALDGDFFGSYWLRGAVHARMGNFGPAHADMRRAIQLSAGYPPLLAEMNAFHGWVYLLEKRYSTARKVLAASTKLHKQCQTARLVCGMLDLDVGRFQSARSEFRAAVNLGPKNLVANYYYARIMAMCPLKRYRAGPLAVKHAEIACAASNWKGPECLFLLANSHFEAGNEQEAFAWYGQAIKNARHEGQAQWYMFCLEQVKMGKAIRLPLKF
jgi:tetratricopeptide (TPR) repeat protein